MKQNDIIRKLTEAIIKDESKTSMINPERLMDIKQACELLAPGENSSMYSVSVKLHDPFQSVGYIRLSGKEIRIDDARAFCRAASLASNLCVTPKTDGTVEIDLTFHDLTFHIEEGDSDE